MFGISIIFLDWFGNSWHLSVSTSKLYMSLCLHLFKSLSLNKALKFFCGSIPSVPLSNTYFWLAWVIECIFSLLFPNWLLILYIQITDIVYKSYSLSIYLLHKQNSYWKITLAFKQFAAGLQNHWAESQNQCNNICPS